jgi:gamma-glutamylcyclotransferase (GGCT)/AIG2-like uncharacterized protein YtfP
MAHHETQNVFVYGSFLRDAVRHNQIQPLVTSWGRAEIVGKLYQIPTGAPLAVEEEGGKVYGEVMGFSDLDAALDLIDAHEGHLPGDPEGSRMQRKVVDVTLSATQEKLKAYAWFFPKERFQPKEMYAVHCHGGDWRKFVMMPRYDGYQH